MAKKPPEKGYPRELITIGDHIRKRRLDLNLLQKDVAAMLGVDTMSVNNWETGRCGPTLKIIPKIIELLGYDPLNHSVREATLGARIRRYRNTLGMSQKKFAGEIGIDPTTLAHWERQETEPSTKLGRRLAGLLNTGGLQVNRESDHK